MKGGTKLMGLMEIVMIALGLAMDATAVSISNAMTEPKMKLRKILFTAFMFGAFQAAMPAIGYFAGSTFASYIEAFDHWIAFILLGFIGGKMIYESIKNTDDGKDDKKPLITVRLLFVQSVATSIDALAVGISFSTLIGDAANMLAAVLIIGVITFICSAAASYIGKKFGDSLSRKAEIFGGLILIFIGIKILLEHLIAG